MNYYRENIESVVLDFKSSRDGMSRYASYDYCFNHFNSVENNKLTDDMEKSCLALGFYLASWGMFRGSSFLLGKSVKTFVPVIEYIAELDESVWQIDAGNLNHNYDQVIEIYNKIKEALISGNNAHLTLITKIMLGIFGCVPAYDRFFIKSFNEIFVGRCGFSCFNKTSLSCIYDFYTANQEVIDVCSKQTSTLGFYDSTSNFLYKKSKIIDMYGFTIGLK